MSTCVAALMAHCRPDFTKEIVSEIGRIILPGSELPKWRRLSEWNSPEQEFAADGWVSFQLPGDFIVRVARKFLGLDHATPWSAFLMHPTPRQHFLSACNNVARLAGSKEILLLPEGTILAEAFSEN